MSKITYRVFGIDEEFLEEFLAECKSCSEQMKRLKCANMNNVLDKYKHFGRLIVQPQQFYYVLKLQIDNNVFSSRIKLIQSDDGKAICNTEIEELVDQDHSLECNINLSVSFEHSEISEMNIYGWLIYKGQKYECSQTLRCDFSKNNKYLSPGFPVGSTYTADFRDQNGNITNVFIDIISEIIDDLHIMNINEELQVLFKKGGFSINSVINFL